MADQKFNINVNVNADGLQEITQVDTAFKNLRDSINGLNDSVGVLNKTQALYNKQNQETANWGSKFKNGFADFADTFDKVGKLLKTAVTGFKDWTNVLAGVFSLITTLGPPILDILDKIFQSDKTRQAAAALRDYKAVINGYSSNVSLDIAKSQTLVNTINSNATSTEDKSKAVKELNELSPEYLQNLTLENSQTKEGKRLLDEYINSLKRKSMIEALTAQKADLIKQRYNLKPEYDEAKKNLDDYNTGKKQGMYQRAYSLDGGFVSEIDDKGNAKKRFEKVAQEDLDLLTRIQNLDNKIADTLLTFAPKVKPKAPHGKQYWETELVNKEIQLAKLDATAKNFDKKAASIKQSITTINKILSKYNVDIATPKPINDNKQQSNFEQIQQLEIKSNEFAKNFGQQQQQYDSEYAALKDQLDKKLIAETEYNPILAQVCSAGKASSVLVPLKPMTRMLTFKSPLLTCARGELSLKKIIPNTF